MDLKYLLGVLVAIFSGVINNIGALLQKKVVNDLPPESREQRFMRALLKNPLWLFGLFCQVGLGMIAFVIAQDLIGPALVPGLMASGLIVLALGSVKLMGEKLSLSEYFGIFWMMLGMCLLGLSKLDISLDQVREALALSGTVARIAVFTVSLLLCWGVFSLVGIKSTRRKGIVIGLANGFLFALSNFWISPLLAVITLVLTGKGSGAQIAIFVVASALLVGANLMAFYQIQHAFKFGQASNIIPVQQISVQIAPVLVYFYVFSLQPPTLISGACIILGAAAIILSGFLLGRRQSELEKLPTS